MKTKISRTIIAATMMVALGSVAQASADTSMADVEQKRTDLENSRSMMELKYTSSSAAANYMKLRLSNDEGLDATAAMMVIAKSHPNNRWVVYTHKEVAERLVNQHGLVNVAAEFWETSKKSIPKSILSEKENKARIKFIENTIASGIALREVEVKDRLLNESNEKVAELERLKNQVVLDLNAEKAKNQKSQDKIDQYEGLLADYEAELDSAIAMVTALHSANKELKGKLNPLRREIRELRGQLESEELNNVRLCIRHELVDEECAKAHYLCSLPDTKDSLKKACNLVPPDPKG